MLKGAPIFMSRTVPLDTIANHYDLQDGGPTPSRLCSPLAHHLNVTSRGSGVEMVDRLMVLHAAVGIDADFRLPSMPCPPYDFTIRMLKGS